MKGRLLKGGEPDVDGVAKIMLSDWVRGRIPFFVPPPERPEELNKSELKGKRKVEPNEVPNVNQNLESISQKNAFLPEDERPLQSGGSADASEGLSWNDVFQEEPTRGEMVKEVVAPSQNGILVACFVAPTRLTSVVGDTSEVKRSYAH